MFEFDWLDYFYRCGKNGVKYLQRSDYLVMERAGF